MDQRGKVVGLTGGHTVYVCVHSGALEACPENYPFRKTFSCMGPFALYAVSLLEKHYFYRGLHKAKAA
jgi:hypothetical protein